MPARMNHDRRHPRNRATAILVLCVAAAALTTHVASWPCVVDGDVVPFCGGCEFDNPSRMDERQPAPGRRQSSRSSPWRSPMTTNGGYGERRLFFRPAAV